MRVLFIQPDCRQYRVKLFEELSKSLNGLDLLHFGPRKFLQHDTVLESRATKIKISKFHWIAGLYKLVKSYDAVIVMFDPHWLNAFLLSIFFKNKVIYWGHGKGRSQALNIVRSMVGKRAKALVTYDESGKSELVQLGINTNKVFVANNTRHVSNSSDLSSKPKNCFLFVGRIQARKKIEDVIAAFAQVKMELPEKTEITIIGDGSHVSELKAVAARLQVESSINFLPGTTSDEVLKEHFSRAYAYVSPGHVGLGVLHSFAYGVPVITYKGERHAPEYSNIKHGETGMIVEPDVQELGKAMVAIVKAESYKVLGHKAYMHYSNNRKISQMVDAFQHAIQAC